MDRGLGTAAASRPTGLGRCHGQPERWHFELPDVLGHVVDEGTNPRGKLLAAEVADVVPSLVRRMLVKARDQSAGLKQRADLVGRQLSDALPVQHGLKDQIVVIERAPR